MTFNKHYGLEGKHALLSASKSAWVNYDEDKMEKFFLVASAAKRGSEEHAFAAEAIRLGVHIRGNTTLAKYVNDCIGFRMSPEQPLKYSDNAFGTADAVSFNLKKKKLLISDLKTGVTPSAIRQLEVYAAFFCLEYGYRPFDIEIELRIYQSDEIKIFEADPDVIFHIMDTIITSDKRIEALKEEGLL